MNFTFHDINEAYCEMQQVAPHFGEWESTRNGKALVFIEPVLISHTNPERRVLFDSLRDANPFFHYMEAIWMLAGSDSVRFPAKFAKNILNYSDDGKYLHGAYGHRWRASFGVDQVEEVITMLSNDPNTRRAVIGMWNPGLDLNYEGKDLPCNTHIYFRNRSGTLDMTVCNRSNDLVWGCLGANAVHFSILQEYIANATKLRMGCYHQFTNNLHIYEGFTEKYSKAANRWYTMNSPIQALRFSPHTFDLDEASDFVIEDGAGEWASPILRMNAKPMLLSWESYKMGNKTNALLEANKIYDEDWRAACIMWLERRKNV